MQRIDTSDYSIVEETVPAAQCIPCRPRLVRDLWVQPLPDGLGVQVRGAGAPLLLRGPGATPLFAFLRAELNGRRTLYEILEDRPQEFDADRVLEVLQLLHCQGLIVPGDGSEPDESEDTVLTRQLLYWERHSGAGAEAGSAETAQSRLRTRRLVLVATGLFGAVTFDLLRRSGARIEHLIAWDDPRILPTAASHVPGRREPCRVLPRTSVPEATAALGAVLDTADLVVTATRNAPAALFEAINRSCIEAGVPWLRADETGGTFDLGPYVVPHRTACFHCAALREASVHPLGFEERWAQEALARDRPSGQTAPLGEACASANLGASFLVLEVVRIVTGLEAPILRNAVLAVDPLRIETERHQIAPVPQCDECRRPARPRRASAS